MKNCTNKSLLLTIVSSVFLSFSAAGLAQEGAFSDYKQPSPDFVAYKGNFDSLSFGTSSVGSYGTSTGTVAPGYYGNGLAVSGWPANGQILNNGTAGFAINNPIMPQGRTAIAFDIRFMYKADVGAPKHFRVDLTTSLGTSIGTSLNGGIIDLTGSGSWLRANCHRLQDLSILGSITNPTQVRIVAIQDLSTNYPSFGVYNPASAVSIDNLRVTVPRRLSGLYMVTGTTDKNLGTLSFNNLGTGFKTYTDWIQNLGNVDLVNTFGTTDLGGGDSTSSSNLIFTYVDSNNQRQFGADRLTTNLNGILDTDWIGSGVLGNSTTDQFYGAVFDPSNPSRSHLIRQTFSSVYSQSVRALDGSAGYAMETNLNLGGDQLVGVGDFNCDGAADFITRSGSTFKARLFTGFSGTWPSEVANVGSPINLSAYGRLTCLAVGDIDGDGFDDMLLTDSTTGDVFSLMCTPAGGTLHWVFRLTAAQHEKIYALADADGDGQLEIYSTRQRQSDSVGEINVRKLSAGGGVATTFDLVAEFDFTHYIPCAIGDMNGDGSADVVLIQNVDSNAQHTTPDTNIISVPVDPTTRRLLGLKPYWIGNPKTLSVRPIFYHGLN